MCKISIVTVTYNAQELLRPTIESVLSQSCNNFEYLIADGLSSDDTVSIAEEYRVAFEKKNVKYRILSRKDSGIYNAMNQAAEEVSGEYILYMNAGDLFCKDDVLEKVQQVMNTEEADIYYGDVVLTDQGLFCYSKATPLSSMAEGIPFCHQSVFTATRLLRQRGYDETLKVCADHDFYAHAMVSGARFHSVSFPISVYALGGASSADDARTYLQEKVEVARRNALITDAEYKNRITKANLHCQLRKLIRIKNGIMPQSLRRRHLFMALLRRNWVPTLEMALSESSPRAISKVKLLYRKLWTAVHGNRLQVANCAFVGYYAKIKKTRVYCSGNNNTILVMPGCYLDHCTFHISGDNNTVILWDNGVYINVDFWLEDNNNRVVCGPQGKMTGKTQLAATEGKEIAIGSDCLFSDEIIVRTGDSHGIFDANGRRINPAADVHIGSHVWVCHGVNVLKGANVPAGSVIGTGAVVGKGVYVPNGIIAGNPAAQVKTGITWKFDR